MVPQFMRGMWPGLMQRFEVVLLEPNQARGAGKSISGEHGLARGGFLGGADHDEPGGDRGGARVPGGCAALVP